MKPKPGEVWIMQMFGMCFLVYMESKISLIYMDRNEPSKVFDPGDYMMAVFLQRIKEAE